MSVSAQQRSGSSPVSLGQLGFLHITDERVFQLALHVSNDDREMEN